MTALSGMSPEQAADEMLALGRLPAAVREYLEALDAERVFLRVPGEPRGDAERVRQYGASRRRQNAERRLRAAAKACP